VSRKRLAIIYIYIHVLFLSRFPSSIQLSYDHHLSYGQLIARTRLNEKNSALKNVAKSAALSYLSINLCIISPRELLCLACSQFSPSFRFRIAFFLSQSLRAFRAIHIDTIRRSDGVAYEA